MSHTYQIHLYDTSGVRRAIFDAWRALHIDHQVGQFSQHQISLSGTDPRIVHFQKDCIVEVRRRDKDLGIEWYTEYIGFHITPENQVTDNGISIFTSYGRGLLDLIHRRTIRYYADTDGDNKGPGPADDIIKSYVRENAGPMALMSNRRVTDGVIPGLTIAEDASAASNWQGAQAWRNLLDAIREIGQAHSVDFDVLWNGGGSFTFQTYYPLLGTDRTLNNRVRPPVLFSPELGNLSAPTHTQQRTDEVNSVLVLGPGESVNRDTTLRLGTTQGDSPWNLIEDNYDDSGEDKETALNQAGDTVLVNKRPAISFSGTVLQTRQTAYGRHYFLGDMVTAKFGTVQADVKIDSVAIDVGDGKEAIAIQFVEPAPTV